MIQYKKIFMTLAALFALTTGAWAQVVLWDGTGKEIGSDGGFWNCAEPTVIKEEDNEIIKFTIGSDEQNRKAQLPIGDSDFKSLRRLTFRMKMADQHDVLVQIIGKDESYTVERTATYNGGNSWQDMVFEFGEGTDYDKITDTDNYSLNIWPYGNTADGQGKNFYLDDIKLVSESGIEVTWDAATKTASFTMPAFDVELNPIFAPTAQWAKDGDKVLTPAAVEGVIAGTENAIVTAGTVAKTGNNVQGTVMYKVTSTNEAVPTSTEGFSADLPTAKNIDDAGATVYVWYYIKGADAAQGVEPTAENTFSDLEICPVPLTVIVLANKYDINFNAANANTIEAGKATVKVGDAAAEVKDGKLEGVKMDSKVTITAKEGYKFRKVEAKKKEEGEALEGRTFVDFKIEFRTNPYSVITPATGNLPDGVSVTETTYNGTQHGVQGGTITVPVDGPVKFTIGACYYSKADIVVKKDGELFTTVNNNATCGETTGNYSQYVTYKYNGEAATLTFESADNVYMPYFFAEAVEPSIEVTINDTETEASFDMPAYEVAVDYELVRDMTVSMQALVGDGTTDQPRYRVKKKAQGSGYEPAELKPEEVTALFSVNDLIEQATLVQGTDYTVSIYAIDEQGQPTGDAMTFANFTFAPGIYAVTATATEGTAYEGTTGLSNTFKLFEGYEVTVAAGEYITYYKDENLYTETENAELYTINNVSDDKAVLSDELDIVPANTPMLVFNNSQEAKTILLIPTESVPNGTISVYSGFKGTLEAATIPASDASSTNYAFNGKQFVWVKDAITVAANRAWLEIPAANAAHVIELVFGDATAVEKLKNSRIEELNGNWYDLNGRKLQAAPTKKGVYIMNGKKVVIK